MVQATGLLQWPTQDNKISSTQSERQIIARCKAGDNEAFGVLVHEYQDRLYNTILKICNNSQDARELTQDAFMRAFQYIDRFDYRSGFYTWLCTIALNSTRSFLRRSRLVKFISIENGDGQYLPCQTQRTSTSNKIPNRFLCRREIKSRVMHAISELDVLFRAVVVLRDVENMKYHEIAETLDIPYGTVKSRLHHARNLLKAKLVDLECYASDS